MTEIFAQAWDREARRLDREWDRTEGNATTTWLLIMRARNHAWRMKRSYADHGFDHYETPIWF